MVTSETVISYLWKSRRWRS